MNGHERIIATLAGKETDRIPVLPKISYASTLAIAGGMPVSSYMNDADCMSRAVIEAYRRFGFDGVSVHSDISSEGIALGSIYEQPADQPRLLKRHLMESIDRLERIAIPDPHTAPGQGTVIRALGKTVQAVGREAFVVAWTNAPLNVASQLLPIDELLMAMLDDPESLHSLLEIALAASIRYGEALAEAGADAIAYGHAMASCNVISPAQYEEFALPYERRLCDALHKAGVGTVITHICGRIEPIAHLMSQNGADVIDFDHVNRIENLRRLIPNEITLRGNIDPVVLQNGSAGQIHRLSHDLISESMPYGRFILGSGCEISKQTPPENLMALADAAKNYPYVK